MTRVKKPRPDPLIVAAVLAIASLGPVHACGPDEGEPIFDEMLGGDTTAFSAGSNAFELSARNLSNAERRVFEVGDSFFTQNWVSAPSSTDARDGLGPTFNAQSCSSCHKRDGRARPPQDDADPARGLLLRLSVDGANGPAEDPVYGGQIQDRAINSVPVEGRIRIRYEAIHGNYPDGKAYTLHTPTYGIVDAAYGPLDPDTMVSPRIAPSVFGMGLLEAIPVDRIMELADEEDSDGDGISGRPNMVWDIRKMEYVLGRFGWKANQPTVEQQTAAAFHGGIGITSSLFPEENCTSAQAACRLAPDGGSPEIPNERLSKVVFYVQTLAVPAMRNVDSPEVRRGARLFVEAGCALCHTPRHTTAIDHLEPALAGQVIFPYTDLLLHDMGDGLADGRPDGLASGREWRTPPLWGIGLVETVNGHTRFLHDGRARSIEEAILWHDGEGRASRDLFKGLSSEEREALLQFMRSL